VFVQWWSGSAWSRTDGKGLIHCARRLEGTEWGVAFRGLCTNEVQRPLLGSGPQTKEYCVSFAYPSSDSIQAAIRKQQRNWYCWDLGNNTKHTRHTRFGRRTLLVRAIVICSVCELVIKL
jgi:hypothetical protein